MSACIRFKDRLTLVKFASSAGTTSATLRSTSTPPMRRKHFRAGSTFCAAFSVSTTALCVASVQLVRSLCAAGQDARTRLLAA
jgi:hypothetical protein